MGLSAPARSIVALGLLVAGSFFVPAHAQALGPYPDLGSCQVFPGPPASAATIAYIDSQGGDRLHPDFGSPRTYGFPYAVVGAGQPALPIHYTAYGEESDRGPFPIPTRRTESGRPLRLARAISRSSSSS